MSEFSIKPEEVTKDILETPITFDDLEREDTLTDSDRDLVFSLYADTQKGDKRAIAVLRKMIQKYPDEPFLKNHLAVALQVSGKDKQAEALASEIRQNHPDYLFGHLNKASLILKVGKDPHQIPDILGVTLRLKNLLRERDVFHFTEIKGYYNAVGLFHLALGRIDLATEIHKTLTELLGEDDTLQNLQQRIWMANLEIVKARMEEDEKTHISVKVTKRPTCNGVRNPPAFHHEEIEDLYEYGDDLPPKVINKILNLPRESLIDDLEKILRDVIDYGVLIENQLDDDDISTCASHALFLLGELKAERCLPTFLELLSLPTKSCHYWLSTNGSNPYIWIPLYQLAESQLDLVETWIKTPGIPGKSRDKMIEAVTHIAYLQPDRRREVVSWIERLMRFMAHSPLEDNIVDTDVTTCLVWMAMDLGAIELKGSCIELYEKQYISVMSVGDLDEILESLDESTSSQPLPQLKKINEVYRNLRADVSDPLPFPQPANAENLMSGENSPFLSSNSFANPFNPSGRATNKPEPPTHMPGRNEPCTCGSGKKYKKCCLQIADAS